MEEIVIVPDSELDGTNVLVLPTNIDFEFSYGPGSYTRSLEVCNHVGSRGSRSSGFAFSFDIDDPDDLHHVL